MNSTTKYLISVGMASAGLAGVGFGIKLIHDGVEEIDDTLFDWRANKFDMYEASYKGLMKTAGGIGLGGLGGLLIGGALTGAVIAGQDSMIENAAPVQIAANTLEEAEKHLEALKLLANSDK